MTPSQAVKQRSRTRSVAYCGLSIALIAVSAWISIPIGPVPVTLQIFTVAFVILVLKPKEALATILIYLGLGAIGLPVFSAMRGGLGVLAGPTGGFLWGYILGILAALVVLNLFKSRSARALDQGAEKKKSTGLFGAAAIDFFAVLIFLLVAYACGWVQFMFVMGASPLAAFLTSIAPFIVIDIVKIAVAVVTATAVKKALPN